MARSVEQLRAIAAVVATGSFDGAAMRLRITPSARRAARKSPALESPAGDELPVTPGVPGGPE